MSELFESDDINYICEKCENRKKLQYYFRYIGHHDRFKFRDNLFEFYVAQRDRPFSSDNDDTNNEDETEELERYEIGDIVPVDIIETLQDFSNSFPWVKTMHYGEEYDIVYPRLSFCSDCFEDLILTKKIKYLNNGTTFNFPVYTDCCNTLHKHSNKELISIFKRENFPYTSFYTNFNGNKYMVEDDFPYKNNYDYYTVCKKCVNNFEKDGDLGRAILFDHPLINFAYYPLLKKDFTSKSIDDIFLKNHEVTHLKNVASLKEECKEYFDKRTLFNETLKNLDKMIYLNKSHSDSSMIGSANYLNKNIKRIIARKIVCNYSDKKHPFL